MNKPLVQNAGDRQQIQNARKKEKNQRDLELDDIRIVLSSGNGRRFIWRLLMRAGVNRSIWEPSAKIHYNAGQQDFGHFIMAEIIETDENLLFQMMSENKKMEEQKDENNNRSGSDHTETGID